MTDRSEFQEARAAGLAKRHEQRLAQSRTVEGLFGVKAQVQESRSFVHLKLGDEAGSSNIALTPERARLLAQILILTVVEIEEAS